jgi:hypothetical protein
MSPTNAVAWALLVTEDSALTIAPTTAYFQTVGNVAVSAMLANGTQGVSGAVLSAAIQRLATPPMPALPGTQQTLAVSGFDIGNTYYFGIKSTDQAGNESDLSNVQMVRLPSSIVSAKVSTNGQFQCTLAGEAGRSCVVQVSTNLTQWTALNTNSIGLTSSSFIFTDSLG